VCVCEGSRQQLRGHILEAGVKYWDNLLSEPSHFISRTRIELCISINLQFRSYMLKQYTVTIDILSRKFA